MPRMERVLEREGELSRLEGAIRGLSEGRGCLVLVGSEAGGGKTTLVRVLRGRVGERIAFMVGACESLSVPVPLGPLRELAEAAGDLDLVDPGRGDRLVLARELLALLADRAPTVAVVEDAHWADASTLDVLRLLARRVERSRVMVVVTYRDDEVAANPELARLLGDLATNPSVTRVQLRPLSEAAVRELAEPAGIDPAQLSRATGGNPFLVVEAIAAGGRLPASVRDATLARAGRLGSAAREAVEAAAVIGQRVELSLLEQVAPGSGVAVDEALNRGVMVADGQVLGFRHELIREAIEASLSPPRRADLHGRVVAALGRPKGPGAYARLAHHAELAGLAEDASRFAALAAADAERVGALRETSLQAARALRLGAGLDATERLELLLMYSHAANFSSLRLEDAVAPAREAIALAQRLGDRVRQGRGEVALSYALWSLGRVVDAREAAERAVAVLETADDVAALARSHATRVRMEATAFDPAAALELAPRAFELAGRPGLEETRLSVTISVGLARGHLGDAGSLPLLREAAGASRAAGFTIQTVRAYVNLVVVAVGLRRHEWVERVTEDALALFDEYQTTIPANAIDLYRARSRFDRGRWEEALAIAARPASSRATLAPDACVIEGLVAARRGGPAGRSLLEQAWAANQDVPESARHGAIRVALVEAAWLRDDRADALRRLRETRDIPTAARFARSAGELAVWGLRHGLELEAPPGAPEPVKLELAGDWRGAITAWQELDSPYEAALAALPGDDRAARAAVPALHELGATAAARAFAPTAPGRAPRRRAGPGASRGRTQPGSPGGSRRSSNGSRRERRTRRSPGRCISPSGPLLTMSRRSCASSARPHA
jgi:tetratricopeptide (TPR) repeat protein